MPVLRRNVVREQTASLPSVAHFLPLSVAARRLADCGRRMLLVVRSGLVAGLLREDDLLDPERRSDPDVSVGSFVTDRGARLAWLTDRPTTRRDD
jgi:hypothetical protein